MEPEDEIARPDQQDRSNKTLLTSRWKSLSQKYKYNNYLKKAADQIKQLLADQYNENSIFILRDLEQIGFRCTGDFDSFQVEHFRSQFSSIIAAYRDATSSLVRRLVLGLIPETVTMSNIREVIPGVTCYQIRKART